MFEQEDQRAECIQISDDLHMPHAQISPAHVTQVPAAVNVKTDKDCTTHTHCRARRQRWVHRYMAGQPGFEMNNCFQVKPRVSIPEGVLVGGWVGSPQRQTHAGKHVN